jgi:hypothetical protein
MVDQLSLNNHAHEYLGDEEDEAVAVVAGDVAGDIAGDIAVDVAAAVVVVAVVE